MSVFVSPVFSSNRRLVDHLDELGLVFGKRKTTNCIDTLASIADFVCNVSTCLNVRVRFESQNFAQHPATNPSLARYFDRPPCRHNGTAMGPY